jgi:hypothetical protein
VLKRKLSAKSGPKNNILPALIALFVLIIFLLVAKVFSYLDNLSQPFELSKSSDYQWDTRTSNNVLFVNLNNKEDPLIYLVNFSPKNKEAVILHLSNQIYAQLPKEYGTWRLGSIYQLGQEEKPPVGVELLKMSVASLVGQPVDAVIIHNEYKDPQKMIDAWRQNPLMMGRFLTAIKTDLEPLDTFKYITSLSTLRQDKLEYIDLEKSSITKSRLLPDSTRVLGIDTIRFDLFVREKMPDPILLEESKTISVYNATDHPGLAQEAARVITNLGGNVIIVGNTQTLQEKSLVVAQGDQPSITLKRLSQIFAPDCLKNRCNLEDGKILNSRALINVVIGEDYYKIWHTRN